MSDIPTDLKYASSHEWVRVEGDTAVIGISDHAQQELTDLAFIELPEVGADLSAGDACGVVESVKTASDLYAPVSGEVTEINDALESEPGTVNEPVEIVSGSQAFRLKVSANVKLPPRIDFHPYGTGQRLERAPTSSEGRKATQLRSAVAAGH